MKRLLFIYNLHSGKGLIRNHLADIIDTFNKAGYETVVYSTQERADATRLAKELGAAYDLVVCSGGDGTLSEVLDGVMTIDEKRRPKIGYIPAGSTNDYAYSLGLPSQMKRCANVIAEEKFRAVDVGKFQENSYFVYTIYVQRETVTRDIPFSIICALLLLGLGMIAVGDATGMTLGHFDGILFLILFAGYIGLMIKSAMKARAEGKEVEANDEFDAEELKVMSYPKSILYIVGGAIAIAIGGDLTVDTASRIAIDLGMSQTLVGLTIVSIGTSLPELVTSVVAARKNEVDMAVGNAVGSNIFNILMVLGIASAINPVSLIRENVIDIIILVVFSVVVWIFAATKKKISRKEGIAMVAMYLVYAVYIILR